jgi:hypothetical protein
MTSIYSFILASVLLLSGCASTLPEIKHDVDEGAVAAQKTLTALRQDIAPFAEEAVRLCKVVKIDDSVCAELDADAETLFTTLESAQHILDLYGKGQKSFADVYAQLMEVVQIAEDYVRKVVALREHSKV